MKKPIASLLSEIRSLATKGARFASLIYQAKKSGEIARHTVCLGVSLGNAYERDLAILTAKLSKLSGVSRVAALELIQSLSESLAEGIGNNSRYTCAGVYETIAPGVKLHSEKGELHVYGFSIGKTVIVPGVYPDVKSSLKTIAKNAIRRTLKSGRFRQFAVSELERATLNGATLVFE